MRSVYPIRQIVSINVKDQISQVELASIGLAPKPYAPPKLALLGDLRSVTLGGSVGPGDSGSGSIQEF